ncbi:amidase family protein [Geodermatophilus sp. CPCC 205506]|uniref:amidase family protein n=1 Tax=Geodermatophilus sp. CPCC 205506 TaxID=2936596 RepID=UPI003EEDF2EF
MTRTVDNAALALDVLAGYDDRDPFALDDPATFAGATRRSIRGRRIARSPDFGVYPVDRRVAGVVQRAVPAFEDAGAAVDQVDLAFDHDQRELSDLWCRLIMPLNIEGLEGPKAQGLDLLGDHRDDSPQEYLRWIVNFTGHPAASIPAGDVDGLPVGMQMIGRRYCDADVLAASAAYGRLRPWQDAYARCAARSLASSAGRDLDLDRSSGPGSQR